MGSTVLQQLGLVPATHHTHIASGTHALLKPHQLHIEAMRVHAALRPLQPQRQAPALAGAQGVARVIQPGLVLKLGVPTQRQLRRQRHGLAAQRGLLHLEGEAQARRAGLWQPGHHTGDQQVLPFQC